MLIFYKKIDNNTRLIVKRTNQKGQIFLLFHFSISHSTIRKVRVYGVFLIYNPLLSVIIRKENITSAL